MSKKNSNLAQVSASQFGFVLMSGNEQASPLAYPIAYAQSIWDVVKNKEVFNYTEVDQVSGNPKDLGYYEYDLERAEYVETKDTEAQNGKHYFQRNSGGFVWSELLKMFNDANYIQVSTPETKTSGNQTVFADGVKYYEREGNGTDVSPYVYTPTEDTAPATGKTYYQPRAAGPYTQHDLNEKMAELLNSLRTSVSSLNTSVTTINSSGNYVYPALGQLFASKDALNSYSGDLHNNDYAIVAVDNNGIITYTFCKYDAANSQWVDEYTWRGVSSTFSGTGNYKGKFATKEALNAETSEKNDYALLKSYKPTSDETAQEGKIYYADVNGTALQTQPTTGTNIKSNGYYEEDSSVFVVYKFDEDAPKQIKVGGLWFTRNENGDLDPEHVSHAVCWTNGSTNVYSKVENVKARSGSSAQEDEQVYGLDGDNASDIDDVFANWREEYTLNEGKFTVPQWDAINSGEIDKALKDKLSALPTAVQLRDELDDIEDLIPDQASSENQLADKAFVNSSISTNTATFRGVYESVSGLPTSQEGLKANDYAFVIGTPSYKVASSPQSPVTEGNPVELNYLEKVGNDYIPSTDTSVNDQKTYYVSQGNPSYNRYKYTDVATQSFAIGDDTYERNPSADMMGGSGGADRMTAWTHGSTTIYSISGVLEEGPYTFYDNEGNPSSVTIKANSIVSGNGWIYEFTLNNSSFTATQWETINTGLTRKQQAYLKDLYDTNVASKAQERFRVSEVSKSGAATVYADAPTKKTLAITVKCEYNYKNGGQNQDQDNWLEVAGSTTNGDWSLVDNTTGTFAASKEISAGSTGSLSTPEFTFTPATGEYEGIECHKNPNISQAVTKKYPAFYGFSAVSSIAGTAAGNASLLADLTRMTGTVGNQNEAPTEEKYFWIIVHSGTPSATQNNVDLWGQGVGINGDSISFMSRQTGHTDLEMTGYKAYRSQLPFKKAQGASFEIKVSGAGATTT